MIEFLDLHLCVDTMLADLFSSTRADDFFMLISIYHNVPLSEQCMVFGFSCKLQTSTYSQELGQGYWYSHA